MMVVVVTYVSMLRGINVGGRRKVRMEELKRAYDSLGLGGVRTYIQSGNVIFEHPREDEWSLAARIEKRLEERLGFPVPTVLRTAGEVREAIRDAPFVGRDPGKLHVTFLSAAPREVPVREIDAARTGAEDFAVAGREVYLYLPDGYGRTRLTNAFFERKLGVTATTRNWKTVNALSDAMAGPPPTGGRTPEGPLDAAGGQVRRRSRA